MMRKKILIVLNAQFAGLMSSVGRELGQDHDIVFSALDPNVYRIASNICRDMPHAHVIRSEFASQYRAPEDVLAECLRYEGKYGLRMGLMCSFDRALGKGFLVNVDRHPDIIRSWWPSERKYVEVLKELAYWEHLVETCRPDLILGFTQMPPLEKVAAGSGVPLLSLASCRVQDFWFWADNPRYTSRRLVERLQANLESDSPPDETPQEFGVDSRALRLMPKRPPTYWRALAEVLLMAYRETKSAIRGSRKKDSYRFLGWAPSRVRRVWAHRYVQRHGVRPSDLAGRRKILVAMHLEPENSLMVYSPEFNSTMEMVMLLAKAVPADTRLVLKEHPLSFGIRSRSYYDMLLRLPNVVLAHPESSTQDWLQEVDLVATITSTVGIEAVLADRPVISYGRHQLINLLPSVRYANDYESTCRAVRELLEEGVSPEVLRRSRTVFFRTQEQEAFRIPGIERLSHDRTHVPEAAQAIVAQLLKQYGEALGLAPSSRNRSGQS